jgi:predicted dehydrogenase
MHMPETYRVGIIGFAHMHINHLAELFAQHPQVEMAGCADTRPARAELREGHYTRGWNLRHATGRLGVKKAYDDYRDLLGAERLDIVLCCSENANHHEVVEACAAAGVHVLLEKPMSATLEQALRMVRAAEHSGIRLLVNWPMAWDGAAHRAKQLIDEGAIGRVLQIKWRGAHTGPLGPGARHMGDPGEAEPLSTKELAATWWHHDDTGGGAFLDYCCYGCMVSRWFIGEQALAAMGMRANLASQWADGDDNGVMIARFPSAIGLYEASWTTVDHGVPYGPIIYGQTGTLVMESRGEKRIVRQERGRGQSTIHEPLPLPAGRDNIAREFIHHLESGQPVHPTLDMHFNLEVQAILDAGWRSANSGRMEVVENAVWRIG